jgi:hypothetical protein
VRQARRCLRCDYGKAGLAERSMHMIQIRINGQPIGVAEGSTILQAAKQAGIQIPRCATWRSAIRSAPAACAWWRSRARAR